MNYRLFQTTKQAMYHVSARAAHQHCPGHLPDPAWDAQDDQKMVGKLEGS
jgi:hypothetical protein